MIEEKKQNMQIVLTRDEVNEILKEVLTSNGLNITKVEENTNYDEYLGHIAIVEL